MISSHVVKLITEYLDQCETSASPATLVGVHWYVDGHNKTLPLLEEVNEALRQRPNFRVSRAQGAVTFASAGSDYAITSEDLERADRHYRKEFRTTLKKLS